MDFSAIFQIRTKKFWWMDVIFYFVMSLLVATVLCYVIFLTKNNLQREDIKKETIALQGVGTERQKEGEKEVIGYQKKISDFSNLLNNHEFASNVFAFMQSQAMQNIWFKQFSLDKKKKSVQLSGESDDMDAFSRQVATFEKNKYVKSIGTLNSSIGNSARIEFDINLLLDQSIFSYLANTSSISETIQPQESLVQQSQEATTGTEGNPTITVNGSDENLPIDEQQTLQSSEVNLSSEKLMISFRFLLNPEVVGIVNEANHKVILNVPYGTDVKNLTPSIVVSPEATVLPDSNVPRNFTNSVIYQVVAQDGSVQSYDVGLVVGAPLEASEGSSQFGFIALIIIVLLIIIVTAAISLFIWRKRTLGAPQSKN